MIFKTLFTLFMVISFSSSRIIENINSKPGLKLVIDHDGGADDAMAITMMLLSEKYFEGPKVVGLTTIFGNVNNSQAIINSARILELCKRCDVPIYAGSERALIDGIESDYYFGFDGLGDDGYVHGSPVTVQNVHAAIGLIEISKKYEGDLIVLAIGPVTNIALAIRLDPKFISRLKHLYVGAGTVYGEKELSPEFNADMDPEAYYIVANSSNINKVTIVPFSQVKTSLDISNAWRKDVLGAIETPVMKALNGFERISFASSPSWTLLDPVVASVVLDKHVVTQFTYSNNGIILCGNQRGINTNNFTSPEPNARLFYSGDVEKYKQLLIDIYSAEL